MPYLHMYIYYALASCNAILSPFCVSPCLFLCIPCLRKTYVYVTLS